MTLRTTFIVGFPGETEADFEELRDFVAETDFDHVGVFTYSHEEDTRAFALVDDVPARVKKARRDGIMRLQKRLVAAAPQGARRHRGPRDGGRSVARLAAGDHRPARGPGPGHRLDRGPVRLRSVSEFPAGRIISARVSASRAYDLVAVPLPA